MGLGRPGLMWDGFGAALLVALAACDAGVVDGVAPASCGWDHVVRLGAAGCECGSPGEWLPAIGAVRLSVGLCEVEDADAPALVACGAGAGGAGSRGHGSECSTPGLSRAAPMRLPRGVREAGQRGECVK